MEKKRISTVLLLTGARFIAIIKSSKRLLIKFKGEKVMKKVVVFLMAVLLIALGVMSTSAASVPLTDIRLSADLADDQYFLLSDNVECHFSSAGLIFKAKAHTECYVTPINFSYVWARLQKGEEIVFDSESGDNVAGVMTMEPIKLSSRVKPESVWHGAYRTINGEVSGERDVDARIEIYDDDYITQN